MATNKEKQLAILLLRERLEKVTGKKVILKEGTWSIPKSTQDYVKARKALEELSQLKTSLYSILDDDIFMDGLDKSINRGYELLKLPEIEKFRR